MCIMYKQKKADSKGYILLYTVTWNFGKGKIIRTKHISRCQAPGLNESWPQRHRRILVGDGTVLYLDHGGSFMTVTFVSTDRTINID